MSVENLNIIVIVSIDAEGKAILTISDHLEWDKKNEHFLALQNKINVYLDAIENGSLFENYPEAKSREIVINIVVKYAPNEIDREFLERTKQILNSAGYGYSFSYV